MFGPTNIPYPPKIQLVTDQLSQDILHIKDQAGNIVTFIDLKGNFVFNNTNAGMILADAVTGKQYRLTITNGVLTQSEIS